MYSHTLFKPVALSKLDGIWSPILLKVSRDGLNILDKIKLIIKIIIENTKPFHSPFEHTAYHLYLT